MRAFFRDFFFLFSRKDLFRFTILVWLLILGTVIELVSLGAVPVFVGILTRSGSETVLMRYLQSFFEHFDVGGDYAFQIRWSSLLFLGLFIFRTLYLYFSYSLQQRILKNRYVELGSRIFAAYMAAPYSFMLRRNSQDLVNSVVVESDRVVNRVLGSGINLLRSLVVMLGVVLMLIFYTPLITIFAFTSLLYCGAASCIGIGRKTHFMEEAEAEKSEVAMEV